MSVEIAHFVHSYDSKMGEFEEAGYLPKPVSVKDGVQSFLTAKLGCDGVNETVIVLSPHGCSIKTIT
jgi:hypothetical protein